LRWRRPADRNGPCRQIGDRAPRPPGIWNNDKPDDERDSSHGGADDKVFRLDRVGVEECKSLMPKDDELAALEQQ
jgi:hypothetical protein